MKICSCLYYSFKYISKKDPCLFGWGCSWIRSSLKYPQVLIPEEGVDCEFCGDTLYRDENIKIKERKINEIEDIRQKHSKIIEAYRKHKESSKKGLATTLE